MNETDSCCSVGGAWSLPPLPIVDVPAHLPGGCRSGSSPQPYLPPPTSWRVSVVAGDGGRDLGSLRSSTVGLVLLWGEKSWTSSPGAPLAGQPQVKGVWALCLHSSPDQVAVHREAGASVGRETLALFSLWPPGYTTVHCGAGELWGESPLILP